MSTPTAGGRRRDLLRAALVDGSLDEVAARHDLALVVLFGSAADPAIDDPGDLDLAAAWVPGARKDQMALTADLAAHLGDEIDVVDLDIAPPLLRERALTRGTVLLQRVPGTYARQQMRASRDTMDTAHLRRAQLELMAGER